MLLIKDEVTKSEVWIARLFSQLYRKNMKNYLVPDSANAKQHAIRILVALASIFGFMIFSTDVTQAHLQSG